jgi:hypothetical protein
MFEYLAGFSAIYALMPMKEKPDNEMSWISERIMAFHVMIGGAHGSVWSDLEGTSCFDRLL